MTQASLYFQWLRWARESLDPTLNIWIINMDETSMQNEYATKKGYVISMAPQERDLAGCFHQRIDASATRSHSTLAAFISSRPNTQQHMPQIFIPNQSRTTAAEMTSLKTALKPPSELWENLTGWVTAEVMKNMLTRLRQVVRTVDATATLVLLMDAASQHISKDVLLHARKLNVVLIMIPGKLTWLLQPLDVSVFRVLKDDYKQRLLQARMSNANGIVTTASRHVALNECIQAVLVNKDWTEAFDKVGALGTFNKLRKSLQFYFPSGVSVPALPLNDAQLEELAGRHRINLAVNFNSAPQRLLDRSQSQALVLDSIQENQQSVSEALEDIALDEGDASNSDD